MLALLAGGCGDDGSTTGADMTVVGDMAVPDLATAASVARGEELVKHVLFCGTCHTTPDASGNPSTNPTDFLAGGKAFTVTVPGDGGTITVYAPNLTPDDATGTGSGRARRSPTRSSSASTSTGLPLWPTMPYQRFAAMTRDDAESIGLYIKSLAPHSHAVTESADAPDGGGDAVRLHDDSAHDAAGDRRGVRVGRARALPRQPGLPQLPLAVGRSARRASTWPRPTPADARSAAA